MTETAKQQDNTPGCTKQACGYSERYPQFEEKGAVVLGISKDSVASHKRFEEKQGLTFTLLSDTELEVIKAYVLPTFPYCFLKCPFYKVFYAFLNSAFPFYPISLWVETFHSH